MSGGGEEGGGHDERWVISYADLVTLLFGFFIILFASAQVDQQKFIELSYSFKEAFNVDVRAGNADGASPVFGGGLGVLPGGNFSSFAQPDVKSIRTTFDDELLTSGLTSSAVDVLRDGDGVIIRVSDRLLFSSASAELNPEAVPLLKVVAGVLRGINSDVRVEGHTDNVPVASDRYPTNWELSSARATTVLRFLLDEGIEPRRLVASGYAEFHPIASNTTPEGRAINRRADIVLTRIPAKAATPAPAAPSIDPRVTPVTSKGGTQ